MSDRPESRAARKTPKANGAESVHAAGDRFEWLLGKAATLIASKGFHHMSMRDVSRATGYSLAGLYHYVDSKETLLFEIQERFFSTLVEEQARICAGDGPVEDRFRALMENHLAFFAKHADELKVCTYELHSLAGEPFDRVAAIRKRYFRLMADVIKEIVGRGGGRAADLKVRHQTMFVFGALNWIFMWYEEKRDGSPSRLAEQLSEFILHGLQGAKRDGAGVAKRKTRN
ncbi:MAG: TetR/AcrR family transcriptional regulator [Polyangiaceae bacterium]|jgi:AcrR family transcriptional regulator|nr:TetR/AcrR family transcriptional regulator [Polyangiaceae bacterium]